MGQSDTENLVKTNIVIAVVWTFAFFLFMLFIFMSIFMAIFIESHESTVSELGYPSDFMDIAKWEYRDYMYWAIDWVPDRFLPHKRKKNVEEENHDTDNNVNTDELEEEKNKENPHNWYFNFLITNYPLILRYSY